MITYHLITQDNQEALQLENEAFPIIGRLQVSYTDTWHYEESYDKIPTQMTFPNEDYLLNEIIAKGFAIGALANSKWIGLAIFDYQWNHYVYLNDLKVNTNYRQQGVASKLLHYGEKIAKDNLSYGLCTIAQDNNLLACRFYLKYGFKIGGFNTMDYHFTTQKEKADIYFYKNFK